MDRPRLLGESVLDAPPKIGRVDGGETVERGLDLLVGRTEPARFDERPVQHCLNVLDVLRVPPFQLGKRLRVEVEVAETHTPLAASRG